MVKIREKCYKEGCNECDIFPLYSRGYDNKFKRVTKEKEVRGEKTTYYGHICLFCKEEIIWRHKKL